MTHELINIINQAVENQRAGLRQVLATVVDLDGSSYRKPGVRMLMDEMGNMCGAVSGGCVEKEVFRRAQAVFESGEARVMSYDGRYRLGCEGIMYIMLEPFQVSDEFLVAFTKSVKLRQPFEMHTWFQKQDDVAGAFGSRIYFSDQSTFSFSDKKIVQDADQLNVFRQYFKPRFKLMIIGGEHDSVKLCKMAAVLGWEIEVFTSWKESKELSDFPGAEKVIAANPESLSFDSIDSETAVVIMTHNFSLDLKYLMRLKDLPDIRYLGLIGSTSRRDRLHDQLLTLAPDVSLEFIEQIYSPAGLDIGSVTPEEIALSILSEILSTIRNAVPQSLKNKSAGIHS